MLRIITGTAKNTHLKTPDHEKFSAVQEVAKGSLFSMIGEKINNLTCLDLYAGSGNLGLEALSRGAKSCDFVEKDKRICKIIEENVKNCGFENKAKIYPKDSIKFAANIEKSYDLIFVDPYYDDTHHVFLMENLEEILKPKGVIAFFHGENLDMTEVIKNTKLVIVDERKFGQSIFTILGHKLE